MKTTEISKFKTYALKISDRIAKTREIIITTKQGNPSAQISPYRSLNIIDNSKTAWLKKITFYYRPWMK